MYDFHKLKDLCETNFPNFYKFINVFVKEIKLTLNSLKSPGADLIFYY